MQKLPSVSTINNFNSLLKNYNSLLSFCDPNNDYNNLKESSLSTRSIINCLRAIIFNIEANIICPKIKNDLLSMKKKNNNLEIEFILNTDNIIDFKAYCSNSPNYNIDTNKYNYILEYRKIVNEYKNKIKELYKIVYDNNNFLTGGSGKTQQTPNFNIDNLELYELVFYHLIVDTNIFKVNGLTLSDITNIYLINPDVSVDKINTKNTNVINIKNQSLYIKENYIKINDQAFINILKDYIKQYNIQHNQKLLGDKSISWFSREFKKIFNCSFTDFKNYFKKQ